MKKVMMCRIGERWRDLAARLRRVNLEISLFITQKQFTCKISIYFWGRGRGGQCGGLKIRRCWFNSSRPHVKGCRVWFDSIPLNSATLLVLQNKENTSKGQKETGFISRSQVVAQLTGLISQSFPKGTRRFESYLRNKWRSGEKNNFQSLFLPIAG